MFGLRCSSSLTHIYFFVTRGTNYMQLEQRRQEVFMVRSWTWTQAEWKPHWEKTRKRESLSHAWISWRWIILRSPVDVPVW